jgi:O-antigen/teichoic acid export membrane protein
MLVSQVLAGGLSYALQISMGRMLSTQYYGLFAALVGMFNIATMPLTALFAVITRSVAREFGRRDIQAVARIQRQAMRELALGGAAILSVAFLSAGVLAALLGSVSLWPVLMLWAAVGVNALYVLWGAVLQGIQRFLALATINTGMNALKLLSCVVLVELGFGVSGAVLGLLAAAVAGGAATWIVLGRRVPRSAGPGTVQPLLRSKSAVALAVSNLAFVGMTQFDYIIVRVFSPAGEAGLYAAAAVLAKSVLWLPVGIVVVLFPTVASAAGNRARSRHLLYVSLGMALVTSGGLAVVLAAGADTWMRVLYGPSFAGAAVYLRWLSLIYVPMALVLIVDNYNLAMNRARFIPFYALAIAAEVVTFSFPGGTPTRLVWVLAFASMACLLWATWILIDRRSAPDTEEPSHTRLGDCGG